MNKSIILFLFFVGLLTDAHAVNIDSLRQVSDTATGKHLCDVYGDISSYYWKRNPFLSMEYAKKAMETSKSFPNDTALYIEVLQLLGDAHWYNNNPANSLEYALEVLRLKEKRHDSAGVAKTLNNLGVIYSYQGKHDKALELFQRSMELKKALGDTVSIASNINNIGQIYFRLDDYEMASKYFKQSIRIRKNAGHDEELISGYNNLAAVYIRLKSKAEAVKYLNRAYEIADSVGVQNQLPIIMYNLGDIFYELADVDAALEWFSKSLEIAINLNNFDFQYRVNERLSEVFKERGDYKQALHYKTQSMANRDTITSRNTDFKLEQLQFKYEATQTELENVELKQQKEINDLKLSEERSKNYLLMLLVFLSFAIVVLLINRYALRIRHNKQLHKEVELRNRSLMREIDERKRLQSQQKIISKHFISVFSNSPLAILTLDGVGNIQLVNDAFAKLFDIDKDSVVGQKFQTVIPEKEMLDVVMKAMEDGNANFKGKLQGIGGAQDRYVRVFVNHYEPKSHDLEANTFVIIEDVSESVSAEERIKASEQRFHELADFLPEMLVETDMNGKLSYANNKALQHFGFTRNDIQKGIYIFDLVAEPDRDLIVRRFKEFVAHNKSTTMREYQITSKLGTPIFVHASISTLYSNGLPVGFRGVLIDLSERIAYEKKLLEAKEKAEKADNLKTIFLQSLSHEIRTPMNGILGFSELIKYEEMTDEERNNYIDIIINSSNQLLSIIDDVVNLSRIETGDVVLQSTTVNLSSFFNDLMVYFHGYLMNRNNQVILRLNNKVPEYAQSVIIAEKQVQHVLSNLIYNSIKHTKKGFIEIGVEKIDSKLKFYVKDSGVGLTSDLQNIIFKQPGQYTDKNNWSGLGLGLAIAKGLVDLLGGEINVDSEVGKGSMFYFIVPYVPSVAKTVNSFTSDSPKMEYPDWSGKRLLIVEDDFNNYLFLEQLLKKTNAIIHHLLNGQEAVDFFKEGKSVEIVLMDIQMPVMDGYEATRLIRELNIDVPILAQTANAMVEDKNKSIEAGCDDYIAKPVNKKVLLNKMSVLLKRRGISES